MLILWIWWTFIQQLDYMFCRIRIHWPLCYFYFSELYCCTWYLYLWSSGVLPGLLQLWCSVVVWCGVVYCNECIMREERTAPAQFLTSSHLGVYMWLLCCLSHPHLTLKTTSPPLSRPIERQTWKLPPTGRREGREEYRLFNFASPGQARPPNPTYPRTGGGNES